MSELAAPTIELPGGRFEPVIRAILTGEPDYVCVHGGRGSAKTETIAGAIALRSSMTATLTVAMRERQRNIRESMRAVFVKVIRRMKLPGWHLGMYELSHVTGSRIVFEGLHATTVDGLRSMPSIDIAWGDEAQKFSHYAVETLLPTIREDRAQVIFSLNPTDPQDIVYRDFVEHLAYPEDTLTVQANYDVNPFFTTRLNRQRLRDEKRDPEFARHKWRGEPAILSASQIFKRGTHWDVDDGADVPHSAAACYGLDIGMGNHPSIILRVFHWDNRIHVAAESVDMALTQSSLEDFIGKVGVSAGDVVWSDHQTLPWNRASDTWSLKHAPKHAGGEDRGVKWIKGHWLTIHPDCTTTLHQWPRYGYKVKDDVVLPEYDDHDDDAPDCVRYALHKLIYGKRRRTATGEGASVSG